MDEKDRDEANAVEHAPLGCEQHTEPGDVEDEFYDVEAVLGEMEVTPRPTREQFEMIRDAEWGDVLVQSPDPMALIERLAKLATRLDRQDYSGGELEYRSFDGDGVMSGADSIWQCWLACCVSLAAERPELAQEQCALPLEAVGRVFRTWSVGLRIVGETAPSAVSE